MTSRLALSLSLSLLLSLAACSPSSSDDLGSGTQAQTSPPVLQTTSGPVRLRGTCAFASDWGPSHFEVDAGADAAEMNVGSVQGPEYGRVSISLGGSPDYAVTLKTFKMHAWTDVGDLSVTVEKPLMHLGDTVALEDTALERHDTFSCQGTVVQAPMHRFLGKGGDSFPLADLTAPLLDLDLFLPDQLSCGVALRFPEDSPVLPPYAVALFVATYDLTGAKVDVTRQDDHTLVLRTPDAHGWDAAFAIETSGHTGPIVDILRILYHLPEAPAPIGTFEVLRCPASAK